MSIVTDVRSTVKAICTHEGKVLLNHCRDAYNGDYYCLPGGGQEKYETLLGALQREMLEETGYTVTNACFAALYEEICDHTEYRAQYPQYCHKMYHIFLCSPQSMEHAPVSEMDDSQIDCEWIDIGQIGEMQILPRPLGRMLPTLIMTRQPVYIGSDHIPLPHG